MITALFALVCLGVLEVALVCRLLESNLNRTDMSLVLLAISPIVAAVTIIVFLLLGTFRGFKESDMKSLPVNTALRGAILPVNIRGEGGDPSP